MSTSPPLDPSAIPLPLSPVFPDPSAIPLPLSPILPGPCLPPPPAPIKRVLSPIRGRKTPKLINAPRVTWARSISPPDSEASPSRASTPNSRLEDSADSDNEVIRSVRGTSQPRNTDLRLRHQSFRPLSTLPEVSDGFSRYQRSARTLLRSDVAHAHLAPIAGDIQGTGSFEMVRLDRQRQRQGGDRDGVKEGVVGVSGADSEEEYGKIVREMEERRRRRKWWVRRVWRVVRRWCRLG